MGRTEAGAAEVPVELDIERATARSPLHKNITDHLPYFLAYLFFSFWSEDL